MSDKEKNVTTVGNEDKNIIRLITTLSTEDKLVAKGILIGMYIRDKQSGAV